MNTVLEAVSYISSKLAKVESYEFNPVVDKDFLDFYAGQSTKIRRELVRKSIQIKHNSNNQPRIVLLVREESQVASKASTSNNTNTNVVNNGHEYIKPNFHANVIASLICGRQFDKFKATNIRFVGPHGSGKTEYANIVASDAGFGKVYHLNGRNDMTSKDFLGCKTVVVDDKSMQNYIEFQKGPLYDAFIHGTKVDEDGFQVLDENGNPEVVGKPAIFFLDEYAAIDTEVFLSVFNRAMEIPRIPGESRSIEISDDGGRIVKSHPGFSIILSGNTLGKGIETEAQAGYTAQDNMHDDSTLDRINGTYTFGYNLKAERNIIIGNLSNDSLSMNFIKFIAKIRNDWVNANIETLFSTRDVVKVCDQFRLYKASGLTSPMARALKYSVFSGLREREYASWKEHANTLLSIEIDDVDKSNSDEYFNPVRSLID